VRLAAVSHHLGERLARVDLRILGTAYALGGAEDAIRLDLAPLQERDAGLGCQRIGAAHHPACKRDDAHDDVLDS